MLISNHAVAAVSRLYAGSAPAGSRRVDAAGSVQRPDALELSGQAQSFGEDFSEGTGGKACALGELHGDIGRPVAVVAVAGALNFDGFRNRFRVEGEDAGVDTVEECAADREGKFFRSHAPKPMALPAPRATWLFRGSSSLRGLFSQVTMETLPARGSSVRKTLSHPLNSARNRTIFFVAKS